MGQFITAKAVLEAIRLLSTFFLLTTLPLLFIMLIKKYSWQHPIIRQFNNCIRHGTNFGERECQRVEQCLQQIKNRFTLLRGKSLPPEQQAAPVSICFKSLSLIAQMSKSNTCCALHVAHIPPFKRTFACKQKLEELVSDLEHDEQLPLVRQELTQIKTIIKKIEQDKTTYRLRFMLPLAAFIVNSFIIANIIVTETIAWKAATTTYIVFLLLFASNYDYYYSQVFYRYQTHWFTRFIQKFRFKFK